MIGKTLAHYKIGEKIGAGGMGDVWRALDTRLDRDVALKVLPPDAARVPERLERFEREAKAIAALEHPNIIVIYSVEHVDDTHFLTMELVDGHDLSEVICAGGLSLERFLEIAQPLTDAVAYAHARGIAHRDLKPANIMLDTNGRLKVLDFGLAKLLSADAADPTRTISTSTDGTQPGQLLGTPSYMSPEQIAGGSVDARSDIFSLGILFHELLSGTRPFDGSFPAATMTSIVNDEAPALDGTPATIVDIVTRCLHKAPEGRFTDAADLARALHRASENSGADSHTKPSGLSDAAATIRAALDRSEWDVASELLRTLASQRELSAEELELLAESMRWLERWDEMLQALERAQTAYATSGRNRPAARVALDLVAAFSVRHKPAVTRGWLMRAERLLEGDHQCVEAGLLLRRQTADALEACDLERALDLNRQCAKIADDVGDTELQVVALHDHGQILVASGATTEGNALVDEAMAGAVGGAVAPFTLGCLFCRTLSICSSLADFDRSREWAQTAQQWSDEHSAKGFQGICQIHSAETLRHQGQWEDAERAVKEACENFEGISPHAGEAFNELGQLFLWKGDYADADAAFRKAHEYGYDPTPGLPLLRLAQGKGPAALQMMERALTELGSDCLRRAKLLTARITIALALGEVSIAEADINELKTTTEKFQCQAFQAHAALGSGAVALLQGDAPSAAPFLRKAWSIFHETGFVYDAARARVFLARAYRATGDDEDAQLQLDAARKTFSDLGAKPNLEEIAALIDETDQTG